MERLSPTTAVVSLDYKVADLQRRLNKLRFRIQHKVDYLEALVEALHKVDKENRRAEKPRLSKDEIKMRYFENEIHKATLKVGEAEMVGTKLKNILNMLKKEQLGYTSAIDELEEYITEQEDESAQMQTDYDEAAMFKEEMRLEMKLVEEGFVVETKDRNNKVMEIKRELKEKREIFSTIVAQYGDGPVVKQPGADDATSVSASMSSVSEQEEGPEEGEAEETEVTVTQYQNAFTRMARSAGVDKVVEVIDRFTTQQLTNATLEEQSNQAETDIRDMGQLKEELEKENTVTKYLGQDDDVSATEKLAAMGEDIEDNELRVKSALVKIANLDKKKEALHCCFLAIGLELTGEQQGELTTEHLVQFCVDQVVVLTLPPPQVEELFARRLEGHDIRTLQDTIDEIGFRGDQVSGPTGHAMAHQEDEADVFAVAEEARVKRRAANQEQDAVEEEEVGGGEVVSAAGSHPGVPAPPGRYAPQRQGQEERSEIGRRRRVRGGFSRQVDITRQQQTMNAGYFMLISF